eukprot:Rmarinus@m.26245
MSIFRACTRSLTGLACRTTPNRICSKLVLTTVRSRSSVAAETDLKYEFDPLASVTPPSIPAVYADPSTGFEFNSIFSFDGDRYLSYGGCGSRANALGSEVYAFAFYFDLPSYMKAWSYPGGSQSEQMKSVKIDKAFKMIFAHDIDRAVLVNEWNMLVGTRLLSVPEAAKQFQDFLACFPEDLDIRCNSVLSLLIDSRSGLLNITYHDEDTSRSCAVNAPLVSDALCDALFGTNPISMRTKNEIIKTISSYFYSDSD